MVEIINCKVVPGDHVTNQHRLVVMDLNIKVSRVHSTPKPGPKKIKLHRLKDQKKGEFKKRVLGLISQRNEDLNSWWNETAEFVIRAGKEILGESSGKIWKDKETWGFSDEVQRAIAEKKEAKKKWEISLAERDKEEYKTKNKVAKRAVAIANSRAYDQLYEDLDSKEGQKIRNKSKKISYTLSK
ncbi:uncharacterized protein LOC134774744 [Penaeus indicus]|uniref:uncharacterized protein LOC134774744 n=1 Tax=Penaeus indicus TaxID=29960 RepID=UPI00300DB496